MNTQRALVVGVAAVGVAALVYYITKEDPPSRSRPSAGHRLSVADSRLIEEQNREFFRSQQDDIRKERERKEEEEFARVAAESLRYFLLQLLLLHSSQLTN
eukprot:TRINITY_DN2481_c0_g1_i1.p1 TRINITY_DN2481_c0_g1~~TRINITY_DN2481_c0_g1_i1.p1  ORF type:complete len:101 (-),score=16.07 TRINITY_DN2481_c0_g1_i1:28-330(-)